MRVWREVGRGMEEGTKPEEGRSKSESQKEQESQAHLTVARELWGWSLDRRLTVCNLPLGHELRKIHKR